MVVGGRTRVIGSIWVVIFLDNRYKATPYKVVSVGEQILFPRKSREGGGGDFQMDVVAIWVEE